MSFMKNVQASAKSLIKNNIVNIAGAGEPTSGTSGTGKGICGPGSLYFSTSGVLWVNDGSAASPSWLVVIIGNADHSLNGSRIESGTLPFNKLTPTAQGLDNGGTGLLKVIKGRFDPSATAGQRTIAAHALTDVDTGAAIIIPDDAVICGGFLDIETTFVSATDAGTIAVHVQGANDIFNAAAISTGTGLDEGLKAIIPKANTPESTGIKLTAARGLTVTVGVEALTAGRMFVYVYYVGGDAV